MSRGRGLEDIFSGPIRDGNRGGLGLFKWDSVKEDHKNKEHYLGSTIKAAFGRWQKNKSIFHLYRTGLVSHSK